jgi:tetratricopeptide (TPR) repeat protein
MRRFLLFCILFLTPFFAFPQSSQDIKETAERYREEGLELQSQGDLQGALTYYQRAIQLNPSYYEVYNDLGIVYEALGDKEMAEKMYETAISINPEYLAPYANLALLYEDIGEQEKAIYYWKRRYILGSEGDYWSRIAFRHLLMLGISDQEREELFKKKVDYFSRDLSYPEDQKKIERFKEANSYFNKGRELFSQQDFEGAVKEFQTARSLVPPNESFRKEIDHYYHLAKQARDKRAIQTNIEQALSYLEEDRLDDVVEKLKDALSIIFSIRR